MNDQERLEAEIEQTREHLAATVDELTATAIEGGKTAGKIAVPVVLAAIIGFIWWKKRG